MSSKHSIYLAHFVMCKLQVGWRSKDSNKRGRYQDHQPDFITCGIQISDPILPLESNYWNTAFVELWLWVQSEVSSCPKMSLDAVAKLPSLVFIQNGCQLSTLPQSNQDWQCTFRDSDCLWCLPSSTFCWLGCQQKQLPTHPTDSTLLKRLNLFLPKL